MATLGRGERHRGHQQRIRVRGHPVQPQRLVREVSARMHWSGNSHEAKTLISALNPRVAKRPNEIQSEAERCRASRGSR